MQRAAKPQKGDAAAKKGEGFPLTAGQWKELQSGLSLANAMLGKTVKFMNGMHNHFLATDPRTQTASQDSHGDLFSKFFKTQNPGDAIAIEDSFKFLAGAVGLLKASSFRVVPDAVVKAEEGPGTLAFARIGDPVIFVSDACFSMENELPAGSAPPVDEMQIHSVLTTLDLAKMIIHESAHFRLGVVHGGGVFDLKDESCEGYPIRSFSSAANNAYVYHLFAACVWQSAGPN